MGQNKKLNKLLRGIYDSLTEEQQARALACESTDELMQFAAAEGLELPDEVLSAVAGGYLFNKYDPAGGDAWEIIDERGDVVEGGFETREAATARALELGQSTEHIQWSRVEDLRFNASRGC